MLQKCILVNKMPIKKDGLRDVFIVPIRRSKYLNRYVYDSFKLNTGSHIVNFYYIMGEKYYLDCLHNIECELALLQSNVKF